MPNLFSGSLQLLTADVNTHIAEVDRGFRGERNMEKHEKLSKRVELLIGEVEDAIPKVGLILEQSQELKEVLEELEELSRVLQKPWTAKC